MIEWKVNHKAKPNSQAEMDIQPYLQPHETRMLRSFQDEF